MNAKQENISVTYTAKNNGHWDIIVAGGGLAGVAAAVAASRRGKRVLLIEKTCCLGGLATIGLVNLFVPMCNGRGTQIIKGMAEELFKLSIKYGFDTFPQCWKDGNPTPDGPRYLTRFSAPIYSLTLSEYIKNEGVDIMYDTIISKAIMDSENPGQCKGVITENKSGSGYCTADMFVDTTGDADLMRSAGVPTVRGGNFHTMYGFGADLDSCKKAIEAEDISKLYTFIQGGAADLYGHNQPKDKPLWMGADGKQVTEYVIENHIDMLNKIKQQDRTKRDITLIPTMPQLRTTCHIDGDATFKAENAYKHFDDSIGAICDFDRRDYLYEIPYGVMVKTGFKNIITAGRSASAEGYGWDVLRVIPPAIITGQAAGNACCQAIDDDTPIYSIDIKKLQDTLKVQDVMIHFDDSLIPDDLENSGEHVETGHI